MSHPTVSIVAVSPARVNSSAADCICIVPVRASHEVTAIAGPVGVMRGLAESILAATGGAPADQSDRIRAGISGRRLDPAKRAKYEAVLARVGRGETWRAAASAEGVNKDAVCSWHHNHKARLRGDAARMAAAR